MTVEEDCSEQPSRFNLAFTLGMATMGLTSFPVGVLFDRMGLFVTRALLRYA